MTYKIYKEFKALNQMASSAKSKKPHIEAKDPVYEPSLLKQVRNLLEKPKAHSQQKKMLQILHMKTQKIQLCNQIAMKALSRANIE